MQQVNGSALVALSTQAAPLLPPPVTQLQRTQLKEVTRKPLGKKRLPPDRRRVICSVRVLPSTMAYLEGMGYSSVGRALDVLVRAVQHRGIVAMLENNSDFAVVNLAR